MGLVLAQFHHSAPVVEKDLLLTCSLLSTVVFPLLSPVQSCLCDGAILKKVFT